MSLFKQVSVFPLTSVLVILFAIFVNEVAAGSGDFHQYFSGELSWGEPAVSGSLSNIAGGSTSTNLYGVYFRAHNKTRVNPWTSYEAVSSGAYVELHHGVTSGENQCFWTFIYGYVSGEAQVTCRYHHHH